ncbi:MAG: nickel-dependent lactate racemase [Candidatus Hydrogenedentota bacterium]
MSETTHTIPYGDQQLPVNLPGATYLDTLDIHPSEAINDCATTLKDALQSPIGMHDHALADFSPESTVAIVVSDSFRQTRIARLLPTLIESLTARAIPIENITITFSTGTHRGPTDSEATAILSHDIAQQFHGRLFNHDATDTANLVAIGETSRGTQVSVNKRVHESDRIILTGSVVLHYFGGFGGGRKSMVPGLASIETIAQNHAMNLHPTNDTLDPRVAIGQCEGNPVAEDMLEATKLSHVDFIINTVIDRDNEIIGLFVGDLEAAHELACTFAQKTFVAPIQKKADLVIAASPTSKNFVQTHKALFNAYQAIHPQGRIILLAPCPEGLGGEQFEKWLRLGDRASIISALRKQSEINGQTALSTREKAPLSYLVSTLSQQNVELLGAHHADSLDTAILAALSGLAAQGIKNPTWRLMPSAAYTVPLHTL